MVKVERATSQGGKSYLTKKPVTYSEIEADFVKTELLEANYIKTNELTFNKIKGGTATLGGANNVNGVLDVRNADNQSVVVINRNGIELSNGAKMVDDRGVYTMIEVVREELVGQMHWQQGGGTIFEARGIELRFYIPPNFTITEAKILLKQYRTRHSNSYPWQTDIDGKLTTVNLYKGTVNRIITITQDYDSVDFGSSSHGSVVSGFASYTAPNFNENSVMSSDIKQHITAGDNYFYISNGSTFESFETPMQEAQYKALLNARLPKSAYASATLMIYGYIK